MKNSILAIGIASILLSCQPEVKKIVRKTAKADDPLSVIQPFEGLEIKGHVFTIETSETSLIELKNGGKIEIPANAFVDSEGKAVKGKVDIEWKEYHTLTDIMLSGIPMKYDSAGVTHDFQSGGMFTIKAFQQEEALELKPGKKAKIDLASIQDSPCYNFYKIDEKSGDWDYLASKAGEKIPQKPGETTGKPQQALQAENPAKDQYIDAQVDYSAFPELAGKEIVAWKTDDKIVKEHFLAGNQKTSLKPGQNPNEYLLEIQSKKQTHSYRVQPVTLQEAKKASRKTEAKIARDFREELRFQNDLQTGKILRSIEIETLGTYNWDAILHIPDHVEVLADFNFPSGIKEKSVSLFFVCPELNATIRVPTENQYENIRFDASKKFNLVGIMADNSVVVMEKQDLQKLKKAGSNSKMNLTFRKTGKKLTSGHQLAEILAENC